MYNSFSNHKLGLDMEATQTRISELIKKSGFSDKQLGKKMDLTVQAVNKWRHGRSFPDIENLFILSEVLDTTVDDMLVGHKSSDHEISL